MQYKPYPKEKRDIICKLPKEEIMSFCKYIDTRTWKRLTLSLPPVNGFRRGSDAEIKERFKTYIRRIGHWTDDNWQLFSELWIAWIKSHPVLDELLTQYQNDQDFLEEIPIPPNSQLDIECFAFLLSSCEKAEIPRELLKQFYDYGYFKEDQKIEYFISLSKSELELKMLKSLKQVDLLVNRITNLENASADYEKRLRQELNNNGDRINSLNTKVAEMDNVINGFHESIEQVMKINNYNIGNNISILEEEIKNLNNYCSELTDSLSYELNNKKNEMVALLKTEIAAFTELLEPNRQEIGIVKMERTTNNIIFEKASQNGTFLQHDSIEGLEKAFVQNFRSIGMTSSGAKQFSKELIATIISQGTITFKGSFASVLALICARTISAADTSICYIPVGLLDGSNFRAIFDIFLKEASASEKISTLIIEGVNLSSFETFAARLSKYIGDQLIGLNPIKTIIICTLVNGPASLECPVMLCDSGPVFNTDCLEWRTNWEANNIQDGVISKLKFNEWVSYPVEIPEDWDDLYAEFSCLGGLSTVLSDRFLLKAAMHLEKMRCSSSIIQSLAFGWLIPRGTLLNIDFEKYKERIAEGKLDAEKPDKRVIKLLDLID